MHTSKLFWNPELKKLEVEVTNRKKLIKRIPIEPDQLAPNVPREVSDDDLVEVDFDRDPYGKILNVRLKGEFGENKRQVPVVYGAGRYSVERDMARKRNRGERENSGQNMPPPEFHNPYNFIPAPPRVLGDNEFGDKEPAGHDRFASELLTGRLTVRMTVETPLIISDTAAVEIQPNGDPNKPHKMYPVRVDSDGKPLISPTAVRGMLRSAYEAVTNSRFSVFRKHDERLAFRADVGEGLYAVPARIENDEVKLYFGTSKASDSGKPGNGEMLYAAYLGKYKGHGGSYGGFDVHGTCVWAYVTAWRHKKKSFVFWNVSALRDGNGGQPTIAPSDPGRPKWWNVERIADVSGKWVHGYVCLTKQNIKNKHDERVFFVDNGAKPETAVCNIAEARKEWKRLVENYQEIHIGENPPKNLAWSRQITGGAAETNLGDGTLCYASVRRVGGKFEVRELHPVMISRRLHQQSPRDLLGPDHWPAGSMDRLSPADRVFGWVGDGVKKDGSYKGHIRIGAVECATEAKDAVDDFGGQWLPLNILGQPKPQQGRFYVAEDPCGVAQKRSDDLTNEMAGYREGKGLRGRKVYPHHSHLPDNYWENPTSDDLTTSDPKFFKEYRIPKTGGDNRGQYRSVKGWVKPETVFEFDIHFTNLSKVELGALVWLLSLNEGDKSEFFHRFGGAKPLGFGSVRLSLADDGEIMSGKDLIEFYSSLENERKSTVTIADCRSEFVKVANPRLLRCFEAACRGPKTGLPTRYPRARRYRQRRQEDPEEWLKPDGITVDEKPKYVPPHDDGLEYEWFVENNKWVENNKFVKNNKDERNHYTLSDIESDNGLPMFDHKVRGD